MSEGPRIGKDEWVARSGERTTLRSGVLGQAERTLSRSPWYVNLALFGGAVALVPVVSDSGYVHRVAFDALIFALLALGLNVAVGWGGLLDLGYIAFFGFGGYTYAILSSSQFDIHLPAYVVIPVATIGGAILGFLIGLPSWRLVGDYLAIVTLFAFQIFLSVLINGHDIFGVDLTGGVNGIPNIDPLQAFGRQLPVSSEGIFNPDYMYVALVLVVIVYVALRFVNLSRIGRAWRALREDPLAAEMMGMPVDWLKLLAFAFGAAVASTAGTLFTSLNAGAFPESFSLPLLITVYVMVIMGGAGSQVGAILGAGLVYVMLEALRDADASRWVFFAAVVGVLSLLLRPRWLVGPIVAGTVAFGFVARAIAGAIDGSWTSGVDPEAGSVTDALSYWVIIPERLGAAQEISYIGLIVLVLLAASVKGVARVAVLVPTLYLAAFVWENVLAPQADVTRFILLGALLVGARRGSPTAS